MIELSGAFFLPPWPLLLSLLADSLPLPCRLFSCTVLSCGFCLWFSFLLCILLGEISRRPFLNALCVPPASGPLHMWFSPLRMFFPWIGDTWLISLFGSLLKRHLLNEASLVIRRK